MQIITAKLKNIYQYKWRQIKKEKKIEVSNIPIDSVKLDIKNWTNFKLKDN